MQTRTSLLDARTVECFHGKDQRHLDGNVSNRFLQRCCPIIPVFPHWTNTGRNYTVPFVHYDQARIPCRHLGEQLRHERAMSTTIHAQDACRFSITVDDHDLELIDTSLAGAIRTEMPVPEARGQPA